MAQHANEPNISHDPRGYLLTPARIIAEDETHVAIALRIEKSTLQQIRPFLIALLDIALDPAEG